MSVPISLSAKILNAVLFLKSMSLLDIVNRTSYKSIGENHFPFTRALVNLYRYIVFTQRAHEKLVNFFL